MEASKTALVGAMALGMGICAFAAKAPGAWGCAASWAALSVALALWERARRSEDAARAMSERGQEAYAKGARRSEALSLDASAKMAARSNVKIGALLSLGSMVALMGAAICALGSFAMSLGWGLLACAPLAWIAASAAKAVADEESVEAARLGREGRDVQ